MTKSFFVKSNGWYTRIGYDEILYIEGSKNYVRIITVNKAHLVLFSMKAIEKFLPQDLFCRIHKSFIVSLDKISEFDSTRVFIADRDLPIGLQYKGELEKRVLIANEHPGDAGAVNHPSLAKGMELKVI